MESMFRGTTICAVKKDGKVAIAGDGQVTMGEKTIFKHGARKVRRIYNNSVIVGFAGAVADAMSLCSRFEEMLNKFSGNLMRSAVELALLWQNGKAARQLDALMLVADKDTILMLSGTGEILEPEGGICAIGSGGNYALAAAKALAQNTNMTSSEVARNALLIASEICIFTDDNIIVETFDYDEKNSGEKK